MIRRTNTRCRRLLVALTAIWLFGGRPVKAQEVLTVLSWNLRDFGATKSEAEMAFIAGVIGTADVAALQEVVAGPGGATAVARLVDRLRRMGADWDYALSDPTHSRGRRSERYAVLWRADRLRRQGRPALLTALDDVIEREPFAVGLRWGAERLVVLSYHAAYHRYPSGTEARHLTRVLATLGREMVLLAGDFNLGEGNAAFRPLDQSGFRPVVRDQPTTLPQYRRTAAGPYLNQVLDNIFYPFHRLRRLSSGIIDTVALCGGDLEQARAISDHVPVWARLAMCSRLRL